MTLVVAIKFGGTPVLIGDFLLTDPSAAGPGFYLPTNTSRGADSIPAGRSPWGFSKKIERINARFVVGFAGSLYPGQILLTALRKQFEESDATTTDVQKFLSNLQIDRISETSLTGWIVEKEPKCFLWNGRKKRDFNIVEYSFLGSGGAHFKDFILPSDLTKGPGRLSPYDQASLMAVTKIGRIISVEFQNGGTTNMGYGYGGEALTWDGEQFRYVGKVLYSFLNIVAVENSIRSIGQTRLAMICKSADRFSIVQAIHLKDAGGGRVENEATFAALAAPLSSASSTAASSISQDLKSDYYSVGISILDEGSGRSAFMHAVNPHEDGNNMLSSDGLSLMIDREQLLAHMQPLFKALKAGQAPRRK